MIGQWFRLPSFVRCKDGDGEDGKEHDDGSGGGAKDDKGGDEEYDRILGQEVFNEDDLNPPEEGNKGKQDLKEGDKSKKDEKKAITLDDVAKELAEIKAENAELKKAAKRAFYSERQERKAEKKEAKGDDVTLSDAEIKAIMKEHKDDPEVIFNAVTYKVQQMMKGGVKSAVNEVEVKNKQEKLSTILRERLGEAFDDDDSDARKSLMKTRQTLNLEDHPFGDFLAYGAAIADMLPNLAKQWYERGKKDALGKTADDGRKSDIEDGKLTPSGDRKPDGNGKPNKGLTDSQKETAKLMGFDKDPRKMKIYTDQIIKRSRTNA